MEITCNNIDKTCAYVDKIIAWLNPLDLLPIAYIGEDRGTVSTLPRPYLELAFHAFGDPVEILVKDKRIESRPGTFILLNAHYGNRIINQNQWSYWCLSLNIKGIPEFKDIEEAPFLMTHKLDDLDAVKYYKEISDAHESSTSLKNARLKMTTMNLLFSVHDHLMESYPEKHHPPVSVKKAMDYIHKRYNHHDIMLKDIARIAGLSPIHFGRIFKRETGRTPMKYLADYRLKRATVLLKRTDLFIGEIGQMVGFVDSLHFSRVFRSYSGLSPRLYRQNQQE